MQELFAESPHATLHIFLEERKPTTDLTMRISKAALVVLLFHSVQAFVATPNYQNSKLCSTQNDVSNEWRRPDLFGTSLVEDTKQTMEEITSVSPKEERALRRRALDKLASFVLSKRSKRPP